MNVTVHEGYFDASRIRTYSNGFHWWIHMGMTNAMHFDWSTYAKLTQRHKASRTQDLKNIIYKLCFSNQELLA